MRSNRHIDAEGCLDALKHPWLPGIGFSTPDRFDLFQERGQAAGEAGEARQTIASIQVISVAELPLLKPAQRIQMRDGEHVHAS